MSPHDSLPTTLVERPLRVVVIDDHEAVRSGLERLLGKAAGVMSVAALADDRLLLQLLDEEHVDVVVLDYDLERGDGLSVCLRLKQLDRPPAVIVYSGYAGPWLAVAAAAAQADALVSKAEPVDTLLDAIRSLSTGARLLQPPADELREAAGARVRDEDLAVLALLLDGVRVAEIAVSLSLSEQEAMRRARRVVGMLQARRATPPVLVSAGARAEEPAS